MVLILVTYLRVNPEGLAYGQLLMQYVSKRFHWTFANVGYLLTARGITQMLVLLVLFPVLSKLLSKYIRPAVKDLMPGRVSACLVIFGAPSYGSLAYRPYNIWLDISDIRGRLESHMSSHSYKLYDITR